MFFSLSILEKLKGFTFSFQFIGDLVAFIYLKATDKLKTEDEKAKEEAERLQVLEVCLLII